MEGDTRRLQPASIGTVRVETGKERYTSDGHFDGPSFSPWRNNVTSLSQRYNLYFVATRESIAVFVPQFPFQKLGRTSSLVISPTLANESAHGYINQAFPHAINHLIVGDLGNEEILVVARDSGNIEAYHTRAVRDAIDKEPYRFSNGGQSEYVGLRAFFSQWVYESAWGLAIHKEARMIAVSANTPFHVASEDRSAKITVFAFALTGSTRADEDGYHRGEIENDSIDSDWQPWIPASTNRIGPAVPLRDRNHKIVLDQGHVNNIPSISFSNTSEDRSGTWLFSTDIEGDMIAWNIWDNEVVNSWTTNPNAFTESPLTMRWGGHEDSTLVRGVARRIDGQTDRGWLVAALDPKAFATASSATEFCGLPNESGLKRQQESFSVTDIAGSHVPGNSQHHPQYREWVAEFDPDDSSSEDDEASRSDNGVLSIDEDDDSSSQAHLNQSPLRQPQDTALENLVDIPSRARDPADEEDASTSNEQDRDVDNFSQSSGSNSSVSSLNITPFSRPHHLLSRLVPTAEEGEQDLRAHGGGAMAQSPLKRRSPGRKDDRSTGSPNIPLLHCSVSHIRLFQAPCADKAHWYCADLLTQMVPNHFIRTAQYAMERLNMIQQIPELGLVIIGSQSGRCAVCSTTRMAKDGPYGLRVDWVLPTIKQEKAGFRPPHALLGIAVGPIQGMLKETDNEEPVDAEYFSDGDVGGTPTSFDPNVVVMDSSDDENRSDESEHEAKRVKLPVCPLPPSELGAKIEPRSWSGPAQIDSWRGVHYSRRYRLMLTYYDWTVLTYEITREAPHLGIGISRKNYRNRSNASDGYHNDHARQSE